MLKVLFFDGILSTQISKASCFCWHPIASCVKSVFIWGHPIDTNIKSIAFFLASYRLMCQKCRYLRHPIDTNIKSIVFLLASYRLMCEKCRYLRASHRHKYQKHRVFAGILSSHVLKVSLFAGIPSTQISKA